MLIIQLNKILYKSFLDNESCNGPSHKKLFIPTTCGITKRKERIRHACNNWEQKQRMSEMALREEDSDLSWANRKKN